MKTPISAYEKTQGMIYFARMLDKIRKHAAGELRNDFTENLGRGFDMRCANLLRVPYNTIRERTLEGGSDEEILQWCFENGRELNEGDVHVWNEFLRKTGWQDGTTERLTERKVESGLANCDEIQTMAEYFEYDEGRKSYE
ncbi:DUF5069 domain-containing protein [Cerasicoccus arenae]|uniref:DUF5069 domain-containing protein n=1 Tax=Cerasicoccus arenae TaxID=424488 RepID=A0A8J3DE50_9BACT|nr:DUF5069 domain-containing protein [Cerasicoccus arenae]MBK1856941.1 DUF5069 domain-containing protein [Cerasicoccus arenae]GHB89960.1 hypothetical protein GCM10007047_00660 [Cerasicoccus arenae]